MWHITAFEILDQTHIRANWVERLDPGGELEISMTVVSTVPTPKLEPGSPDHLYWLGAELQDMTQPPDDSVDPGVHRSGTTATEDHS